MAVGIAERLALLGTDGFRSDEKSPTERVTGVPGGKT
jgi:hypothetical protein